MFNLIWQCMAQKFQIIVLLDLGDWNHINQDMMGWKS